MENLQIYWEPSSTLGLWTLDLWQLRFPSKAYIIGNGFIVIDAIFETHESFFRLHALKIWVHALKNRACNNKKQSMHKKTKHALKKQSCSTEISSKNTFLHNFNKKVI